jgi:hypothetical protein
MATANAPTTGALEFDIAAFVAVGAGATLVRLPVTAAEFDGPVEGVLLNVGVPVATMSVVGVIVVNDAISLDAADSRLEKIEETSLAIEEAKLEAAALTEDASLATALDAADAALDISEATELATEAVMLLISEEAAETIEDAIVVPGTITVTLPEAEGLGELGKLDTGDGVDGRGDDEGAGIDAAADGEPVDEGGKGIGAGLVER